jgi:hypothetical protein
MNIKRKVTALIIISSIAIAASNAAAQDELVGTWMIDMKNITFNVPFKDFQTYHTGGTMTEVQSVLPTLSESPGHGVWTQQGNDYNATFVVFEFDTTKQLIGTVRVREAIRLINQDSISITWKADFILLNGNVIPNLAEGIGSGNRLRLQTLTAVNESSHKTPASFEVLQNYPNPFNPSTTIRFEVPKASYINLKVLDALGREVRTLVDRQYTPGSYFQVWDGKDNNHLPAPSGVYFLQMNAGGYVNTKKMALIK